MRCFLSRLALLLALVIGAASVRPAAGQGAENRGRRLAIAGNVLALTDPDLGRVVLYDVAGPRPARIGAFGRIGSRPGELRGPHGATPVAGDRLYVADTFNHRIQLFDVGGLVGGRAPRLVSAFGAPGKAIGNLRGPDAAVTVSADGGRVFVTDTGNDRIQVFDRGGRPTGMVLGGKGAAEGRLDGPVGTALDPRGRVLYVAEAGNRRVSAFDAASGRFLFAFADDLGSPGAIAVDGDGVVHVTDAAAGVVRRYAPGRESNAARGARPAGSWGRRGTGPGEWTAPHAIAVDGRGRVYVVDRADGRGQVFSAAGAYLGAFGGEVEPSPEADVPAPSRLPGTLCSNGATYGIDVLGAPESIPLGGLFELDVQVREGCRSGAPAETVRLEVEAVMPGHGHGMNTHPRVAPLGGGRFLVTGLRLHMPGRWEFHFDVVREAVLERAQAAVALD